MTSRHLAGRPHPGCRERGAASLPILVVCAAIAAWMPTPVAHAEQPARAVSVEAATASTLAQPAPNAGQPTGIARPANSPPATARDARIQEVHLALRAEALAAGITATTLDRAFNGLEADQSILPLLKSQPEHVFTPWDYMGRLVSAKRIGDGHQQLAAHAGVLNEIEKRYGVNLHIVLAIWGVESSYGRLPGQRPVVRSLATLSAYDTRRPGFWRTQLLTALTILQRGDITPDLMTGSWAGAMGHTQFIPTSYMAHAIDFNGDGRRDIWTSVPDALGSTANYLSESGWKTGEAWGIEVQLPAGFDFTLADPDASLSLEQWRAAGLSTPWDRDWPQNLPTASLLLPAGMHGPAFLIGGNFKAILRYNNATAYALAVGHLADRLAGGPALAALWPTDDPPLDRPGRFELQERLSKLGFPVGPIDGVIGGSSRGAVRLWQRQKGLPEDGWPGRQLLGLLRKS